jgi:hypothetical protein
MRPLRDTKARFKLSISFLGVEGGVLPVVISAAVSAILISIASSRGSIPLTVVACMPFVLTFGYLLIFVTGRRPHFTRDLVCLWLNGKAVSPVPPGLKPINPAKGRLPRAGQA